MGIFGPSLSYHISLRWYVRDRRFTPKNKNSPLVQQRTYFFIYRVLSQYIQAHMESGIFILFKKTYLGRKSEISK